MKKEHLDLILDDKEKALVGQFYDHEAMREAVKKVLLSGLYEHGTLKKNVKAMPMVNGALSLVASAGKSTSNEQLGANTRAIWEGLNALEVAYNDLAYYKSEPETPKKVGNQAR